MRAVVDRWALSTGRAPHLLVVPPQDPSFLSDVARAVPMHNQRRVRRHLQGVWAAEWNASRRLADLVRAAGGGAPEEEAEEEVSDRERRYLEKRRKGK